MKKTPEVTGTITRITQSLVPDTGIQISFPKRQFEWRYLSHKAKVAVYREPFEAPDSIALPDTSFPAAIVMEKTLEVRNTIRLGHFFFGPFV